MDIVSETIKQTADSVKRSYREPTKCAFCNYSRMTRDLKIVCSLGKIYVSPEGACGYWEKRNIEELKQEIKNEE